jgi:uncharacterized protein
MQCPNCVSQTLTTSERRGIEIDHCSNCGGVWLDRGELEKVLALSEGSSSSEWRRDQDDGEGYGRSRQRGTEYDDSDEREGGYEQDDDEGDEGRERYENRDRGEYRSRERTPYRDDDGRSQDRNAPRGEGTSIWREIFENLEKLPLPRV